MREEKAESLLLHLYSLHFEENVFQLSIENERTVGVYLHAAGNQSSVP